MQVCEGLEEHVKLYLHGSPARQQNRREMMTSTANFPVSGELFEILESV